MGPRALLIPVAAVAVGYWLTKSLVASLLLVALGFLVLWAHGVSLRTPFKSWSLRCCYVGHKHLESLALILNS